MPVAGVSAATLGIVAVGVTYTLSLDLPSLTLGANSVKITNQPVITALNNAPLGTTFAFSITANYGNDESGNAITTTTNAASAFIPKVISLADIPSKNTNNAPFSIMDFLTTISTGTLTFSSSVPGVATINSSTGVITPVGEGTTTITANVAATATHIAGSASTTLTIVPVLRLASNGVTIQYTGTASDFDANPSQPIFIQANTRGTDEWFAIISNNHKAILKDYIGNFPKPAPNALSLTSVPYAFFTPPGQTNAVNVDNIITTLMTDMSQLFYGRVFYNNLVSAWDTSNVTNMSRMFEYQAQSNNMTYGFNNSSLQYWDVSKVTDFGAMFANNYAFKTSGALSNWNVSSATNMSHMFKESTFNDSIANWNTSNVTNMERMFYQAYMTFDISMLNVANVTSWSGIIGGGTQMPDELIPAKFRDGTQRS
jgi:hypothetical protein